MPEDANRPERAIAMWTGLENMLTWAIAAHVTGNSPPRFGLFMKYCGDRIPAPERIQMLGDMISQLGLTSAPVYDGLLDDLRAINEARVKVAHAVAIRSPETGQIVYLKIKRGKPTEIPSEDLVAEVNAALSKSPQIAAALSAIGGAAGIAAAFVPVPPRED